MSNRIMLVLLIIIGILLSTVLLFDKWKYENTNEEFSVYIPAVVNTTNNIFGQITLFTIEKKPGNGYIYVRIPPLFLGGYESAIYSSKNIACYFFNYDCNDYDYIININSDLLIEGFSDTAGLTLLFIESILNKEPINNYPITGFMLPNGIIGPIGGLKYKLDATLSNGFKYLVAPAVGKNILPAYTIFQVMKYYYGYNYNYNFSFPNYEKNLYNYYMKKLASQICNLTNNVSLYYKFYNENQYYVAASVCFDYLINHTKNLSINKKELDQNITRLLNYVKKIKCYNNLQCEQIKQQVELRLIYANISNNTVYKYYRYLSAISWLNLINLSNYIKLKNSCNFINEQYSLLQIEFGNLLSHNSTCVEKQFLLSNLYYELVDSPNYLNNYSFDQIKNLIYYYYNKYGISITSYNYLEYSEYLYKEKEYNEALYFLMQAAEYAT